MLRNIFAFFLFIISFAGYAQETTEISDNYTKDVTLKYHVLNSDHKVRQGLYQAIYKKKNVIAYGVYTQGKKTGIWRFYNATGKTIQVYNYDKAKLQYITNEDSTHNVTMYEFIPKPPDTAWATPPVRIGGLLYGYLPYLKQFKTSEIGNYSTTEVYGILQLLVSPIGRLAECKLDVMRNKAIVTDNQPVNEKINTYILNNELLDEDEKQFIPATVNRQQVSSTIYMYCRINDNGTVRIMDH